jgi:hypothetical protein
LRLRAPRLETKIPAWDLQLQKVRALGGDFFDALAGSEVDNFFRLASVVVCRWTAVAGPKYPGAEWEPTAR